MSRILEIPFRTAESRLIIDKGDEPDPLTWRTVLQSPGLSATAELDNDPILFSNETLRGYFAQLAADWRGWTGTRAWSAGALGFVAEHDGSGHIVLTAELERSLYGGWKASVELELLAGELERTARDMADFIGGLEFGANISHEPGRRRDEC